MPKVPVRLRVSKGRDGSNMKQGNKKKHSHPQPRHRSLRRSSGRHWGETKSDYWRYHESVVGDRPELCALDFHLFEDLDFATDQNIINAHAGR